MMSAPGDESAQAGSRVGQRITLVRVVDRYPHFLVEAGAQGVVVTDSPVGGITARMDDLIPGAEAWDNEILWTPDMMGDEFEAIFKADIGDR